MPRAKQRTPALAAHVLDVAVEALDRDGVRAFTTRRVAELAATSVPAIYELFGDKAGLLRAVFFEGFRRLGRRLEAVPATADPRADLAATVESLRAFARDNPVLAELMFSRPFADFDPAPVEREVGAVVRELVVERVGRCLPPGSAVDATDAAHVVLALALGLDAAERAGRLGTSAASMDRRWRLGVDALLAGLASPDRRSL